MAADWPSLPSELISRIWFHYKRARAASTIQAVWRGRDLRDFLEHPASSIFNSRHPRFGSNGHYRRCAGCLLHDLYVYNMLKDLFGTGPTTGAWSVRCLYLMAYDPERVRYCLATGPRPSAAII